ncbi:threonine synthase [Sediminitomix flava]|uniref:Threonine synthase n=1 Tax=Sediminitomix flava TaxID=379075 RepID=A0A316A3Y6_SEDFL|nr:threonine synthase [Sediminitomix flava]PWJ44447.1 L-threonine synthase [Sediminitomix flava]
MKLYSTNKQVPEVGLKEALFRGLPADNGLYMPTEIPSLPSSFFENIENLSFKEIAFEVAKTLLQNDIAEDKLKTIIDDAVNFDAPVVKVKDNKHVLELFHGPTLAFKDFGGRFMGRIMQHYLEEGERVHILVATSGDTGSAVAQGFLGMDGIDVTILYPKGKVSFIQEQQLTTNGQNIKALEIDGTFDDCQRMVKEAFLDKELNAHLHLTSANSINICRLIPQSFYYFYAYAQTKALGKPVVFCTPSGNFGNLCGGLIAERMGLPIHQFIASTNANDIVPTYLKTKEFTPRPSVKTLSNAMDVGNPSNFPRLMALHEDSYEKVSSRIKGYAYNDEQTLEKMKEVYQESAYVMCPHTAVGYYGLEDYLKETKEDVTGIVLGTAHPVKFKDIVEDNLSKEIEMPQRLKELIEREKQAISMGTEFSELKEYLLEMAMSQK